MLAHVRPLGVDAVGCGPPVRSGGGPGAPTAARPPPMLTASVYIVARGRGMAERQRASLQRAKDETDAYIRQVGAKSPADQIAQAKALLDARTIHEEEFARLKAKALQ